MSDLREALQAIVNRWDDDKNDYRGRAIILSLKAALASQASAEVYEATMEGIAEPSDPKETSVEVDWKARFNELSAEFHILSRACDNWREWPGQATSDHDHPDWQAAARALIERGDLRAKLEALRDEMAEHAGIKRPGSKVGIWAKRLTAIIEGKD